MRQAFRASVVCLPIVLFATASVFAQAATQSASDFYLQYRKAFDSAKKIEDVVPFMSADTKKQIEATPAAERAQMFEMIKMMGALTNVKIAKETPTATGATLTVNALDSDKKNTTGTIDIVKENGAWKIGKESWSTK
jgi:Protein of unknown function (DUF3828)